MNNSLGITTTALNSARNIVDQQTQKLKAAKILNRFKKKYNKELIKNYNQNGFNIWRDKSDSGSIDRMLDHAETAN
ncbi:hypothetical protein NK264_17610 [Serratia sp. S0636]|uniref:hypothetical protein n=1 Tax=Serratia TaxID=613 RepID=UPI00209C7D7E|nr:hypothetical protein [Serratia sp. S0636]MCP1263704.1 hypothetical protein [Serratia sp. S0636]HBC0644600.1 hypothetical protein [Serratia marcescens]